MTSFISSLVGGAGGDLGSTFLSQYFNKKNMRDQAALQYKYAERYALNSPSWNIKGLRDAGLNPMLAVSNGVNLGANIPNITNTSPKSDIKVPALDALKASKELDISKQNAASNTMTAESQSTSAAADLIRAQSDAALKQAQTAETLQRTKFESQGKGYKNDVINDLLRGASQLSDSVRDSNRDFNTQASQYLEHGPTPRDFRDTLNDQDRKYYDELEKMHGQGTSKEISKRIRDKYDSWRFNRSRYHSNIFTR